MKNTIVLSSLRISVLGLGLIGLATLAGADDKNKKPASPPPPSRPAPQVSRPAPQPSRPAPQVHAPTPQPPRTNYNSIPRQTNTAPPPTASQGGRPLGNNANQRGTGNGIQQKGQTGKGFGTGQSGTTSNRPYTSNTSRPGTGVGTNFKPTYTPSRLNNTNSPVRGASAANVAYRPAPRNERVIGDKRVDFDRTGRMREIHGRGMEVHRTVNRQRTFVVQQNGRRIVGLGPNRGYVQRTYVSRYGRTYVQRTYVVSGVRYAAVYRGYTWRGVAYYHYVPAFYYHPAFYIWAYNPWRVGITWGWGWGGAPWFGYYGYYFAPYPVYAAPSFWLTDYVLAANLQTAYADQQGAPPPDSGYGGDAAPAPTDNTVQLSPEVKQLIADEVQRQLAAERAAAEAQPSQAPPSSEAPQPSNDAAVASTPEETPPVLSPNSRVFVISSTLDVVKNDGSECSLTAGDIIIRTGDVPEGTKVGVNVITSKRGDCPSNTATAVDVNDLEEMQNQFRQQLDSGLKALADGQGKNGMPAAPDTTTTAGEAPPPVPDASASTDLNQQQKNADQVETEVQKAPGPGN